METPVDKKFIASGKVRVVNASIAQTNTSSLALVLVAIGEDGKPNSKTYDLLDKKWAKVKPEAKGWWQEQFNFKPSNIKISATQSDIHIVHMLCLDKAGAVDERALAGCMKKVAAEAKSNKASVHVATELTEQIPQLDKHLQGLIDGGTNVFLYKTPTHTVEG